MRDPIWICPLCAKICAAHWFDTECFTESHTGKALEPFAAC